jgi:hypothetical protein
VPELCSIVILMRKTTYRILAILITLTFFQVSTVNAQQLSITSPTSNDTYTTTAALISFGGTVSGTSLYWDNINTGNAGIIPVTGNSWSLGAVSLKPGRNEILMTAVGTSGAIATDRIIVTRQTSGPSISNITNLSTAVRVYEKFETRFTVDTAADYDFFAYDEAPPSGVQAKTGITVDGIITTPSGKTVIHPAFFMTEATVQNPTTSPRYSLTTNNYWAIRYAPQETGQHTLEIRVTDKSGTVTKPAGSFEATAPVRPGFIGVSKQDSRYFEFSNGGLYFPTGPAWGPNYSQYAGTGNNFERVWMGGSGAYSSNWAKWISSSELHGNEGFMTRSNFTNKYPGHDLSYEIFYPEGFRVWIPTWGDEAYAARIKPNTLYQVKLRLKTMNLAGPMDSSRSWGFVIKTHGWIGTNDDIQTTLKDQPSWVGVINTNRDWHTVVARFQTGNQADSNFSLYLDNVTGGQVYIDEFSVKEVLSEGIYGAENIRKPKADHHTYVEQRPAAGFDYQLAEAEKYGVYIKYVVHDKNDWIQQKLLSTGQFADKGDGYYQSENTKARWLLRQWYRYLVARYGYSTAVHSWELNNEGPPNEDPIGSKSAPHWRTTQAFSQFIHQTNAHPQLANTSFWCCWRPEFWGNNVDFPDVDHADLHEYTGNPMTVDTNLTFDIAEWMRVISGKVFQSKIGKPTILAEAGISGDGTDLLISPNPGVYYHNMLWAQLTEGGMSSPNYWWSEHLNQFNRFPMTTAFTAFIKDLELNKGGYEPANAASSNSSLRLIGQKNIAKGMAHVWIQNKDYTWKKYADGVRTTYSGTISVVLKPSTKYSVEHWNTHDGTIVKTETLTSDASGKVSVSVSSVATSMALKFKTTDPTSPTPTPVPAVQGDANGDGKVDGIDYVIWLNYYGTSTTGGPSKGDFNTDGKVDGIDYSIWLNKYTG